MSLLVRDTSGDPLGRVDIEAVVQAHRLGRWAAYLALACAALAVAITVFSGEGTAPQVWFLVAVGAVSAAISAGIFRLSRRL